MRFISMQAIYGVFKYSLLLVLASCASTSFANKEQDVSKEKIKNMPVVAEIKQGFSNIRFLEDVVFDKNIKQKTSEDTDENKVNKNDANALNTIVRPLGTANGNKISYVNKIRSNKSIRNNKNYLITYNDRRKLFGVFNGEINITVKSAAYLQVLAKKYNLKLLFSLRKLGTFRLYDVNDIKEVYKTMSKDSNITSINLAIKEDTISKY